jgi:hypothetical protein
MVAARSLSGGNTPQSMNDYTRLRDERDQAYRDYNDFVSNAWKGRDAWGQQKIGDPCTCKGDDDVGEFGSDGTLQERNGRLVSVAVRQTRTRLDQVGNDPDQRLSQYSRADRVEEIRQALLEAGADPDACEDFLTDLERNDNLDQDTGEYCRRFFAQAGSNGTSDRRILANARVQPWRPACPATPYPTRLRPDSPCCTPPSLACRSAPIAEGTYRPNILSYTHRFCDHTSDLEDG